LYLFIFYSDDEEVNMNFPFRSLVFFAAVLLGFPAATLAAEPMSIKVTMPWTFQGPDSFILVADDAGYYKRAGFDVTIDAGKGSVDAINRVASGTYDFGFADINNLIEFNSKNPDRAIAAVLMVYNQSPFTLFTLKGRGITQPKDLEGNTLGAPVFDASYKLFPAFVVATGIDGAKVTKKNMDPALREVLLIRGDVDFISGHYFSSFIDLKRKGVDPDTIIALPYAKYGLDFYGNAVIASHEMINQNPERVKAFVQATIAGVKDVLADPKKGAAAAKKRDPLVDEALELERLNLAVEMLILTPEISRMASGRWMRSGFRDRSIRSHKHSSSPPSPLPTRSSTRASCRRKRRGWRPASSQDDWLVRFRSASPGWHCGPSQCLTSTS
jgi:NitT/TauT family transport system substrate-binding protein